MKKSKVFIGPANIANIGQTLKRAFDEVKIQSDYYVWRTEVNSLAFSYNKTLFLFNQIPKILNKNITYKLNYLIKLIHLSFLILKFDTFIFISPHTILPDNKDLKVLKLFRKKIIIFFAGCVERKVDFYHNAEYICTRCLDLEKQKFCYCDNIPKKSSRVQYYEKYSNYIISQDDSAGYLLNKKPIWPYVIADYPPPKNYLIKYQEKDLTIVHFPSNPLIKMSHKIIPVLEKIAKERGNINLIIKEKIPHSEVLLHLEKAHILIDALGLSYGVLAVEAMARGCIVVCGEMEFIKNKNLSENPLVQVNSNNLYEVLINLIDNPIILQRMAMRSIDFYIHYHAPKVTGEFYKNRLKLN